MASRDKVTKSLVMDKAAIKTTKALQAKLGLAFSSVVRLAISKLAEAEGVRAA
jgi:hypothetical protein